jgi:hypothetical protein
MREMHGVVNGVVCFIFCWKRKFQADFISYHAKTQNRKKRRKKTEETHFKFVLTSHLFIHHYCPHVSLRAVGLLIFFFSLASRQSQQAKAQAVVGASSIMTFNLLNADID